MVRESKIFDLITVFSLMFTGVSFSLYGLSILKPNFLYELAFLITLIGIGIVILGLIMLAIVGHSR